MKTIVKIACLASIIFIFLISNSFKKAVDQSEEIVGAWQLKNGDDEQVLLFADNYFSNTRYSKATKRFIQTRGGTYNVKSGRLEVVMEFDSQQKDDIGKSLAYPFTIISDRMIVNNNGKKETWTRLDNGKDNLAGTWKINARMQEGQIVPIHQTGARKTVKILTATRFQWAAINPETKEFSGTGGGTYTFSNGKYTENIEFFSRDSSRVGASLSFDGKLENGDWHHSGLSSRGDKIYEVWKRIK